MGFPCGSAGKESACNVGDLGSIPGLGRSPGEGKGYPLQYSGLENSMDCIVHGVTKSWTRLSDFHFAIRYCAVIAYTAPPFSLVAQSCPTLCDPMDCSTPGLPVHHQLLESTQTRVHWVSDAIQPSHPLLSPSPPNFSLSQHQGLFQWVSSLHQVAIILEFQLQHQSFQWIFWFPLGKTGWISLQSKWLSRVSSNTTVQKHQCFSAQLSL